MLLRFQFDQNTIDLPIKLVDNPAIDSWRQHFLARQTPVMVDAFMWDPMGKYDLPTDNVSECLARNLDICRQCVVALEGLELHFPYDIPDPDSVDQHWANRAHRWFTHTQEEINFIDKVWRKKDHVWFSDPSRRKHIKRIRAMTYQEMADYRSRVTKHLQDLNEHIHAVENYVALPDMGVNRGDMWEIYLSDEPVCHDPNWWSMDPEWRKYHSHEHHDVIFGSQVLGKTILKSFLDQDDPGDWDTSGHYNNNAALQILPTPHRYDLYRSDRFREWVESHGLTLDQVWYDFPVGDIEDRAALENILENFKTQKFVKVSYHAR